MKHDYDSARMQQLRAEARAKQLTTLSLWLTAPQCSLLRDLIVALGLEATSLPRALAHHPEPTTAHYDASLAVLRAYRARVSGPTAEKQAKEPKASPPSAQLELFGAVGKPQPPDETQSAKTPKNQKPVKARVQNQD